MHDPCNGSDYGICPPLQQTGLATITPAAGFVKPWAAAIIGFLAAMFCYTCVEFRKRMKWDDALDVWVRNPVILAPRCATGNSLLPWRWAANKTAAVRGLASTSACSLRLVAGLPLAGASYGGMSAVLFKKLPCRLEYARARDSLPVLSVRYIVLWLH